MHLQKFANDTKPRDTMYQVTHIGGLKKPIETVLQG